MKILIIVMAYLNMFARISIGDFVFPHPISFEVNESVDDTSDKASIVLARNYQQLAGKSVRDNIKAGMPVLIECGYNGEYNQEFSGYVKHGISAADYPLTVECDELWPLRQKNFVLSYRDISLLDMLGTIMPGYEIVCPKTMLGKLSINNVNAVKVLSTLKEQYGFYSSIRGNTLYVGWAYDFRPGVTETHQYTIGENVKDTSKLVYQTEREFNTRVEININGTDGKKKTYKYGSEEAGVAVKSYTAPSMDAATAEAKAKAIFVQHTYDGFSGSIVGYANPLVHAGDAVEIINPTTPDRQGTYLVEKVSLKYDEAMIERESFISYQL